MAPADTPEMKAAVAKRSAIKGQVTRFKGVVDQHERHKDVSGFRLRLQKFSELWDAFMAIQEHIEILNDGVPQPAERNLFEDAFIGVLERAEMLVQPVQADTRAGDVAAPSPARSIGSTVQLPKIKLPDFHGNYDEWLGFADSFKSLIHDNVDIAPVQKLHYLRGCLRGDAAKIIQALDSSAISYDVAWTSLKERYDNRRVMIQTHTWGLQELPPVTGNSAASLRTLYDTALRHVRALRALGEPVDAWSAILVQLITSKLDRQTSQEWERTLEGTEMPHIDELWKFLKARCSSLEASRAHGVNVSAQPMRRAPKTPQQSNQINDRSSRAYVTSQGNMPCPVCRGNHNIQNCKAFLESDHRRKSEIVKKSGLCFNCLRSGHRIAACDAAGCRICGRKHHATLHLHGSADGKSKSGDTASSGVPSAEVIPEKAPEVVATSMQVSVPNQVLLSTAVVELLDRNGKAHSCRVLLDCAAQTNFITDELATTLGLTRAKIDMPVSGFSECVTRLKHSVRTTLKSRDKRYSVELEFFVAPRITGLLPATTVLRESLLLPKNIVLTDPNFHRPARIDALIGAALYYSLLCCGQIRLTNGHTMLQKTRLGWIVAGSAPESASPVAHCYTATLSLETRLQAFWELEEPLPIKHLSESERLCEEHFKENVRRDATGRYCVKLPFNNKIGALGESFDLTRNRFLSLERRLMRDERLREEYVEFLRQYRDLGHMTDISASDVQTEGYYIPHHAVLKLDSHTTKVRVVFDASAKSSSGVSLNDLLLVGPTLQQDIFSIMIRFRTHTFVLTADAEKMYRQVLVDSDDARYQKILWRESPDQQLKVYRLNTVTYGTASASFLATRTLMQLADDEVASYPLGASVLKRDFYVDDLITGANSLEQLTSIRDELIALTRSGGFHLRQWASNDSRLTESLAEQSRDAHICFDGRDESRKTLGVHWLPRQDRIAYQVGKAKASDTCINRVTKRTILSRIATLFDPIGLLAPVIVAAKILMQQLWLAGTGWDESVPLEIATAWRAYEQQLGMLNSFSVSRVIVAPDAVDLQVHGFCDASERAYGACVYVRSRGRNDEIVVRLVCAKTRVAPIKKISLPRLELCAAVLLSKLVEVAISALEIRFSNVYLWSDSTVTLHWLKTSPHKLKTFVANRVAEIQGRTRAAVWRHVPSGDNPADLASRGVTPTVLMEHSLWLTGPSWLRQDENAWPETILQGTEVPEQKTVVTLIGTVDGDIFDRCSSFRTITRVAAFCLRFANNARGRRTRGPLAVPEISGATNRVISLIQRTEFAREMHDLEKGRPLSKNSKLLTLHPFLDNHGVLRVGGRLKNASLSYAARHPALLPSRHRITELIIKEIHVSSMHAGALTTLYALRERFWLLDGRNRIRKMIRRCVPCFRAKPRVPEYGMGDLPKDRVSPSRPFEISGVDYCGPFLIKEKRHRNRGKVKVYVAIFICFVTKAVHIEVVSDLTTEAFLAALRRFFARRGKARIMYSDNASNFVGARNEMAEVSALLGSKKHTEIIDNFLVDSEIEWKFIPPRSPHFGGIWEAAVRSFKHHLKRSVGETLLTFEELNTLCVQVEAILNSRPLTSLSSDPNDLRPLCPNHFLIGNSSVSLPEVNFSDVQSNRLSNWQHLQKMKQDFWSRWHKEYLNELCQRTKWYATAAQRIQIGDLVLLKEENVPPLQWRLGRITETHPGSDGVVRVVSVRVRDGIIKRAVKKIAPLPLSDD